jgi:hypothetical protein
MQVVISNKSRLSSSPSRITVNNVNNIGRTTFGKIAKVGQVSLENLGNVVTEGKQDGDVLVYQANTNTYNIKTLPNLDGGSF